MSVDVWKQFDQNLISHSVAHHLVTIAALRERHGYARVSDVAKSLNITRGSASLTLKALKQRGLVQEDENRFLLLSEVGEAIARAVQAKQVVLRRFLEEVLQVPTASAEIDTCKIEHLLSNVTVRRLAALLRFLESGDPAARAFLPSWERFAKPCTTDPSTCAACAEGCVCELLDRGDTLAGEALQSVCDHSHPDGSSS
ncbi:MAG: metal-dependent transcriptional regulator [Deltaproteobacteria bacterium]|nr:metal-dependent transcriptional regulator [Deltaproteobacteria bacterium]